MATIDYNAIAATFNDPRKGGSVRSAAAPSGVSGTGSPTGPGVGTVTQPAPLGQSGTPDTIAIEDLHTHRDLMDSLRRTYGDKSDAELIDDFVSRRRYVDTNSVSIGRELYRAGVSNSDQQDKDLALQRDYWDRVPSFWNLAEGGSGLSGLASNVVRGAVDPVNYVGGFLVKGAATLGAKVLGTIGFDAAINAVQDIGEQNIDIQIGRQDQMDWGLVATSALIGGGMSVGGQLVGHSIRGATDYIRAGSSRSGAPAGGSLAPIGTTSNDALSAMGTVRNMRPSERSLSDRAIAQTMDIFDFAREIGNERTGRRLEVDTPWRMRKALEGAKIGDIDPTDTSYTRARLLPGSPLKAKHMLDVGGITAPNNRKTSRILGPDAQGNAQSTGEFKPDYTVKGLHQIFKTIGNNKEANRFLMAVMARRIKAERIHTATGKTIVNPHTGAAVPESKNAINILEDPSFWEQNHGMTRVAAEAKAKTAIDDLDNELSSNPTWANAAVDYEKYLNNLLDYGFNSEMMNGDSLLNLMNKASDGYVPMYSLIEDPVTGKTIGPTGAPARKRSTLGSGEKLMPFTDAMELYTNSMVMTSDLNRFNKQLVLDTQSWSQHGNNREVFREVTGDELNGFADIFTEGAMSALRKKGIVVVNPIDPLSGKGLPIDPVTQMYGHLYGVAELKQRNPGKSYHTYFDDGKLKIYEVLDPDMVRLLQDMKPFQVDPLIKWASKYSRIKGEFITKNPIYPVKAFLRDQISATINSDSGFTPFLSPFKSLLELSNDRQQWHKYLLNGGGMSGYAKSDAMNTMADLKLNKGAAGDYLRRAGEWLQDSYMSKGWKGWSNVVDGIEMLSRYSEFRLTNKHMPAASSAFAGREVGVDFGKTGGNKIYRNYAAISTFFRAGVNSLNKAVERFKDRPVRTTATIMGLVVVPELASYLINSEYPEYDQVPDPVKDTMFLVPNFENWLDFKAIEEWGAGGALPPLNQQTPFIPIPKPLDWAWLGTVARKALEVRGHGGDVVGTALDILQKFGEGIEKSVPSLDYPAVIAPAQDVVANTSWTGADIVPQSLKRLSPENQIKSDTNSLAIDTGRALGVSPAIVDYLTENYFPGLANLITQTLAEANRDEKRYGPAAEPRNDQMDLRIDELGDVPAAAASILRAAFTIDEPIRNSQILQNVLNIYRQYSRVSNDISYLEKNEGTISDALKMEEQQAGWLILKDKFDSRLQQIFDMQKLMTQIANGVDSTPAENAGIPFDDWKRREIDRVQTAINQLADGIWAESKALADQVPAVNKALFGHSVLGQQLGVSNH